MEGDISALIEKLRDFEERLNHLEANAELVSTGGSTDADTVDGFHASATPTANTLLALDASATWPADVVDFEALTTEAQVWVTSWTNDTLWSLPNDANWNDDSQTTTINPRRKSTVIIIGHFRWTDYSAGRSEAVRFRWNLDGTAGSHTGYLGTPYNNRNLATVVEIFTGVTSGAKTLKLQAQKNGSYTGDGMWVTSRRVVAIVVPED